MYSNVKNVLAENEEMICDERVHWVVFVWPIIYAVIGIFAGVFFNWVVGLVILLMTFFPLYNALVRFYTTHLALTNRKILSRSGFLLRDWIQLNLSRVETAYLEEPILGRFLGYSTVIVRGVGTGAIAFTRIINGDEFIMALEKILTEREGKEDLAMATA